jgi:hypothetical protein
MDELSFRLGDTGVVLNSDSTSFPFVDLTEIRGLDSAPFRETQRDHEGDDGGYMDAEFEKGRDISLTGTVYALSGLFETYVDSLKANWAPSRTLVPLYFSTPDGGERFVYVKPLGVSYDWTELRRVGQTAVQFRAFAEDPRIYSNSLQSYGINLGATVFTGRGYNKSYNFGYGGVSTTTDGVYVTVGGNRPTPPVFTIYGPVVNPQILNDTTGQLMKFDITLLAGETLVIRPQYKTVRLNDTTNRRNALLAPIWFYLEKGQTFIRYRAESSDPTSHLTIEFRSAWR